MEFQTTAQEACYKRIEPWMHHLFGGSVVLFDDEPLFVINFGSAVDSTRDITWEENAAMITPSS